MIDFLLSLDKLGANKVKLDGKARQTAVTDISLAPFHLHIISLLHSLIPPEGISMRALRRICTNVTPLCVSTEKSAWYVRTFDAGSSAYRETFSSSCTVKLFISLTATSSLLVSDSKYGRFSLYFTVLSLCGNVFIKSPFLRGKHTANMKYTYGVVTWIT